MACISGDDARRRTRPRGGEFELLLKGVFAPVETVPDLGLELVDPEDGMWGKINVYRAKGSPRATKNPIGNFYEQYGMTMCAYDIPGGAIAAVIEEEVDHLYIVKGELIWVATVELSIREAAGNYQNLEGGSIHMHFFRHIIDLESLHEYCHCYISPPTQRAKSSARGRNAR